jgi:hypothetical protein
MLLEHLLLRFHPIKLNTEYASFGGGADRDWPLFPLVLLSSTATASIDRLFSAAITIQEAGKSIPGIRLEFEPFNHQKSPFVKLKVLKTLESSFRR